MIYEAELLKAIEAAPDVTESEITGLASTDINNDDPNIITVSSKDELASLVEEFTLVLGYSYIASEARDVVRHEGQHAQAAIDVGCLGICFGLRLLNYYAPSAGSSISYIPFIHVKWRPGLSTLEMAAVSAYPEEPSSGDVAQVFDYYGFTGGILEVAHRAMINNNKGHKHIPVPLSFKGIKATRSTNVPDKRVDQELSLFRADVASM